MSNRPFGGHVVVAAVATKEVVPLEQHLRAAVVEARVRPDRRSHHPAAGQVEQFATVGPPGRVGAALGPDLPSSTIHIGERPHEDFHLPRVIGLEGEPQAVWVAHPPVSHPRHATIPI
ncbi:MAG: hypothetical protein CL482_16280 [Acidobacteria bacterium]|nr:hypothetical protein [Acidobacteriota bacterium]